MFLKSIFILLCCSNITSADIINKENTFYFGLNQITPAERIKLNTNQVQSIHLNKIGLSRININRQQFGISPLPNESILLPEFSIVKPISSLKNVSLPLGKPITSMYSADSMDSTSSISSISSISSTTSTTSISSMLSENQNTNDDLLITNLPSQIDNSNSSNFKAFPAIQEQGNENSCVGWSTTYYMMSHEVCINTEGCDNQTTGSKSSIIFSPRWTYNQINSGVDDGSFFSSAFSLLKDHGAATIAQLPYQAGDFRSWDINSQDWRSAITSRMGNVLSIPINSDNGMSLVKQTLLNGHVVVFGTNIGSWIYKTINSYSGNSSNSYAGQIIATYQNGTLNGHAMTIVGYDDDIWTDINGNGVVEPAELGAFKIANSWGKKYGNNGFIWVSYDAFRKTSLVPNFTPPNRIELTQTGFAYLTPYTAYVPKLLARLSLKHLMRKQISFKFASSLNNSLLPTQYLTLSAFQNAGGNYAFDGSTTEIPGTFYFDISALLSSTWDQQNFYFIVSDDTAENPLHITAFDIIDPKSDKILLTSQETPTTIDASSKTFISSAYTTDTQPPTAPSKLTAKKIITATTRKVYLNWLKSVDNIQVKSYLIYKNGTLLTTLDSSLLNYTDTSNLKAGLNYNYSVKAVDTNSNLSPSSNTVLVKF